ncbi:K(+)-transporting ATPase subunit F [Parvibaculum sp.]|nr:K(+)-transporting ATPase subunit F [Parvibaculum sp.]HUD52490.1 K(+)-transporting ATPase subunit F [Parvibaculum sp.]
MSFDLVLGGGVAIFILGYLLVVLARPEKF